MKKLLMEQRLKAGRIEYLFNYLNPQGNSKPYSQQDSLNRAFMDTQNRANVLGLRFRDLRHTAATRMVECGASIVAVNKILRHTDLKTTMMRYAHPENSLREAVDALTGSCPGRITDKSTDNDKGGHRRDTLTT